MAHQTLPIAATSSWQGRFLRVSAVSKMKFMVILSNPLSYLGVAGT